jgi:cytochrome c553
MITVLAIALIAAPVVPWAGWSPTRRVDAAAHLSAHCLDCHGGGTRKGKLDLDPVVAALRAGELDADQRAVLRRARARIASGEMPPPTVEDRPDAAARAAAAAALRSALRTTGELPAPPGPPPRRLNRAEYCASVQDLLGVDPALLGALPPDDVGAGFDNVASVLSLPPSALERLTELAEAVAAAACPDTVAAGSLRADFEPGSLAVSAGKAHEEVAVVWSRGTAAAAFDAPGVGTYELVATVGGMQAGPEPVKVALQADGRTLAAFDVPEDAKSPGTRRAEFRATPGRHEVAVEFLNDFFTKDGPGDRPADRNLVVHGLRVAGPLDPPAVPAWQQSMDAAAAAASGGVPPADAGAREAADFRWLLGRFLRRPPTERDEGDLRAAIDPAVAGAPREARLRSALAYLLLHPEFLFRIEQDPAPPARERDLSPHELAARLAGFLWSSVPDERLAAAASDGTLSFPGTLRAEIDRMLDDPRASRLADRFAPQWLAIDAIEERTPDPRQFAGITPALLGSMRAEAVLFFDTVLRERRPATDLLGAGFTFVDERLAAHYGIPAPLGGGMRRVPAPPGREGGILTQAAVLLSTSNPARTSPVKRGKWVLESLLDAAPPPPPPGTPQLPDAAGTAAAGSMRDLLAAHRADAACAACHRRMDALGFAFEAWDPVGRPRIRVAGAAVDDRGELPDGRIIAGVADLRRELVADPDFVRSLLRHLFTYAFGRECGTADDDLIDRIMDDLGPRPTLRDLVVATAGSPAMGKRGTR